MDKKTELLNYIYQNSKMGIIAIDNIIDHVEDKNLLKTIKEQQKDYYKICNDATSLLTTTNGELKDISSMTKIMTYIDAKLSVLTDNSSNNIAKMMINGSNRGIIEIEEKLNNYLCQDKKITALAKELLRIEKKNLDNLKKYL